MSDRHIRRLGQDYGDAFLTLLPRGQAWPKAEGTTLNLACRGLAEYWGFVDSRAADLLERESDPRYTSDVSYENQNGEIVNDGLLPDWERNWGLPDPCYGPASDRNAELVRRMTIEGSQSREFFIAVAASIGYTITITEYRVWVVGMDRVGDSRVYGHAPLPNYDEWGRPVLDVRGNLIADGELSQWPHYGLGPPGNRFYWTVHVDDASLIWFRVGPSGGQTGVDPHLRIGTFEDLECLLNRWKPAHTEIIFDYSGVNPGVIDPPVISGTTTVGSTLTCTTGNWTNNPDSYAYQWQRDRVDLPGQTANTYVVITADIGHEMVCVVTATNILGSSWDSSNPLNIPMVIPANTALPVISGTWLLPTHQLSCTTGSWTFSPTSYTYQWKRGGANISGATASVYVLALADGGQTITCAVTAINSAGSSAPATSSNSLVIKSFATLDGVATNCTVSGGGLVATTTVLNNYDSGARSTKTKNSGKWYIEVRLTDIGGTSDGCGFAPAAVSYSNFSSGTNSIHTSRGGGIYCGTGNYIGTLGGLSDGTVLQWCIDLDAEKFWVRAGTGAWNGNATADPALGIDGASCASLSALSLGPIVSFGGSGSAIGNNVTFNFGASAFVYSVPTGFTPGWTY